MRDMKIHGENLVHVELECEPGGPASPAAAGGRQAHTLMAPHDLHGEFHSTTVGAQTAPGVYPYSSSSFASPRSAFDAAMILEWRWLGTSS